jgi:hypothetical protein
MPSRQGHLAERTRPPPSSPTPAPTSGADKDQLTNIRAWARANGHPVSDRGRIGATAQQAYQAAN